MRFAVTFITLLALLFSGTAEAQTLQSRTGESIVIENEYISIIVNARDEDTGRFSVNTTGGDPERTGDEDKPLVFGTERSPGPWTSFTTVRVDDKDVVFGGPTGKRAGRVGPFSELVEAPHIHEGREIRTTWRIDDIFVTQKLTVAPGVTTGRPDTARIEYEVTNTGDTARNVGLRVLLDTMLGRNDGAPFQVSGESVMTDTAFRGNSIPDFFQAFDSLANPQVVSQGTLRAFDTTVPDEVYFSNWGSLVDELWNFDFQPGRDFGRAGEEFELDSAVALFWNAERLAPGDSRTYVTYYGLGGITIAPGHLSLGVTSPASVDGSYEEDVEFEVRTYVENTGDWITRDTTLRLENLGAMRLIEGEQTVELGDLAPREARQFVWRVAVPAGTAGEFTYRVAVNSSNADANRVDRTIDVVAPAYLEAALRGPDALLVINDAWDPGIVAVEALVTNTGRMDAHGVKASLSTPIGFRPARGEGADKRIGTVKAGETVSLRWYLRPTGTVGRLPVSIGLQAEDARIDARTPTHFIDVPRLEAGINVVMTETGAAEARVHVSDTPTPSFVDVDVQAHNVPNFYGTAFELHFDPKVLQVAGGGRGVRPGTAFVVADPTTGDDELLQWVTPEVDNERGIVRIAGSRGTADAVVALTDTLATIKFWAVGPGTSTLRLVYARHNPFSHPEAQPAYVVDDGGFAIDVVSSGATIDITQGDR